MLSSPLKKLVVLSVKNVTINKTRTNDNIDVYVKKILERLIRIT
jgi:hypothetical protein